MKQAYRNRFDYGSKFIDNDGICVYCGQRATSLDHFVPLSVLYMANDLGGINAERVTLECCHECNGIAGSHVFKTVAQKRVYIQENLREKYSTLLETPQWSGEELEELGYNLRQFVVSSMQSRDWIERRLQWRNSMNPAYARTAKVRSKLDAHGNGFARPSALINGIPST
jgi:hypothetical protein